MVEKFRSVADDILRITGIWTILIAVLSSIGGGFILVAVQAYWPSIASTVLYGLLGFSIVLLSITAGTVLIQLRRRVPFRIGEVESAIKSWVEAFGYGIRKLDIPDAYFAYQVTASDGNRSFKAHEVRSLPNAPERSRVAVGASECSILTRGINIYKNCCTEARSTQGRLN